MKLLGKDIVVEGDRGLWLLSGLLAVIGTLTVYSASSNLAFNQGGSTITDLLKHSAFLFSGFLIAVFVHRMNYRLFGTFAKLLIIPVILLLIYTLVNGVNISNAARWIRLPFGQTFQPSALAAIVLIAYVARYLAVHSKEELRGFRKHFIGLILPILLVVGFILPANFSTAALIFGVSYLLLFIGGYPLRNLLILAVSGIIALSLFIALVFTFPEISNRVETWKVRMESFWGGESAENYQVTKAKMAIAEGQIFGKGPGKAVLKNFLPQSNSDFIFAVIAEELGTFGAGLVIVIYIWIIFRILTIANRARSSFGSMLSLGLGLIILAQALVNLSVAVNLIPVTGQTLPLVSKGGTSVWMTSLSLGMILSVSRSERSEVEDASDSAEDTSGAIENEEPLILDADATN
ncbi:MAG: FtsW/RodA/SpoVE family cell cycle protein [Bacteroidetes bacterium]|nr:FtsW/RodA/SpoVE family cell cycle protein [Bacteroidota bacterium]